MFETLGRPILLTVEKDGIYITDYFGPHLNHNDLWSFLSDNLPIKFRTIDVVYTSSNVSGKWISLKKYLKRGVSESTAYTSSDMVLLPIRKSVV